MRSAKSKEYAQPPDRIPPADTQCKVQQLVEVMVQVTFSLPSQNRRGDSLSFTTVRFLRRVLCVVRKRPFFGRIGPPPEEVSHASIFGQYQKCSVSGTWIPEVYTLSQVRSSRPRLLTTSARQNRSEVLDIKIGSGFERFCKIARIAWMIFA